MPRRSEREKQEQVEKTWEEHLRRIPDLRRRWLQHHLRVQRGRCYYCNLAITDRKAGAARTATIDHVVPRSLGGKDSLENTVAACIVCNNTKGSRSADEFEADRGRIQRFKISMILPDRLSNDPRSPFYNAELLERGVGILFNGKERTDVSEYCVSEGWVRVQAGNSKDRFGQPMTIKLKGKVEPFVPEEPAA